MVAVEGFDSSAVFSKIAASLETNKDAATKAKSIFQFDVKNKQGSVQQWTLDLKEGKVYTGASKQKADIVITVADADFVSLATGKLNGQKAFMSGKLKIKGNMMLATKLDGLLKDLVPKSKL